MGFVGLGFSINETSALQTLAKCASKSDKSKRKIMLIYGINSRSPDFSQKAVGGIKYM